MASEPAEPTTRQDPEWLAGMIAAFLSGARGMTQLKPWPEVAERLVAWLEDRGLLADPAQTTELEELRGRVEELTDFAGEQANARRESDRVRNIAAGEAADLRDERDTARTLLAEKTEYAGEKAREGDVMSLEIDELTAERDALSLLLRGMARKLVNYRKWMSGDDVPVVHRLRREAEERQARLDAALALLDPKVIGKGDAFTREEDVAHFDAVRAALVGDQPKAEEPKTGTCSTPCDDDCGADCHEYHQVPWKRDHEPETCPGWRGVASERASHRAVEEADDAAGDLP